MVPLRPLWIAGSSRLRPVSVASDGMPNSAVTFAQNCPNFPFVADEVLLRIRYSTVMPDTTFCGGLPRLMTCAQTVLYGGRMTAVSYVGLRQCMPRSFHANTTCCCDAAEMAGFRAESPPPLQAARANMITL